MSRQRYVLQVFRLYFFQPTCDRFNLRYPEFHNRLGKEGVIAHVFHALMSIFEPALALKGLPGKIIFYQSRREFKQKKESCHEFLPKIARMLYYAFHPVLKDFLTLWCDLVFCPVWMRITRLQNPADIPFLRQLLQLSVKVGHFYIPDHTNAFRIGDKLVQIVTMRGFFVDQPKQHELRGSEGIYFASHGYSINEYKDDYTRFRVYEHKIVQLYLCYNEIKKKLGGYDGGKEH